MNVPELVQAVTEVSSTAIVRTFTTADTKVEIQYSTVFGASSAFSRSNSFVGIDGTPRILKAYDAATGVETLFDAADALESSLFTIDSTDAADPKIVLNIPAAQATRADFITRFAKLAPMEFFVTADFTVLGLGSYTCLKNYVKISVGQYTPCPGNQV